MNIESLLAQCSNNSPGFFNSLFRTHAINQSNKCANTRGVASIQHLETEIDSIIKELTFRESLNQDTIAESIRSDAIGLNFPENPLGIIELVCFAKAIDDSSVNNNFRNGAFLTHGAKEFHGFLDKAILAEAIKHGDSIRDESSFLHFVEDILSILWGLGRGSAAFLFFLSNSSSISRGRRITILLLVVVVVVARAELEFIEKSIIRNVIKIICLGL